MIWEPDYAQCFTETTLWLGQYAAYSLPPTGYLVAVTINPGKELPAGDDLNWRAEFEVTDENWAPLYEVIRWDWPMGKCGVMFKEPMPNMNAAHGYWIKRTQPEKCPDLKVITTSLCVSRAA
jgi:hypothetical protein